MPQLFISIKQEEIPFSEKRSIENLGVIYTPNCIQYEVEFSKKKTLS